MGYSSLQIVDATGKVVSDAKEQGIDPNNIKEFLLQAMDTLELTEITPDIVKKYLLADEESTEDDEMTETPKEEKTIKNQGEPPRKGDEGTPGENLASESRVVESLLKKFGLSEASAFRTKEEYVQFLQNTLIPDLRASGNDAMAEDFEEAIRWISGGGNTPTPQPQPRVPVNKREGPLVDVDVEKMYRTGNVGESMKKLLEKFGLVEHPTIAWLLEKFNLNEADKVQFKGGPAPKEDPRDKDLTGVTVAPEGMETAQPGAAEQVPGEDIATATAEPVPGAAGPGPDLSGGVTPGAVPGGAAQPIGPVQAQDMSSPESAKAYLKSEFPEEPFTSTALAFADSAIADPNVYGKVRQTQWNGIWTDKDVLEKQAKIVGEYGNFNTDVIKSITDKFGNTAKYKLARDVRPTLYITVRDVGEGIDPISLSELKGISNAREVLATENPGECLIKW